MFSVITFLWLFTTLFVLSSNVEVIDIVIVFSYEWLQFFSIIKRLLFCLWKLVPHNDRFKPSNSNIKNRFPAGYPEYFHCLGNHKCSIWHCSSLQERRYCLGPALLDRTMSTYKLCGNVAQTHFTIQTAVAYLASLLFRRKQSLIVYGAAERLD